MLSEQTHHRVPHIHPDCCRVEKRELHFGNLCFRRLGRVGHLLAGDGVHKKHIAGGIVHVRELGIVD